MSPDPTSRPVEDWLTGQATEMVASWDRAIDRFYPQHARTWSDPATHVQALTEEWNHLDAVRVLPWASLLTGEDLRVLDLGAGTGWLSAELSRLPQVARIDALDASARYLGDMLPEVVRILEGDSTKIWPIRGLFSPLRVDDGTYDAIVSASALHHEAKLVELLGECRRAVKPDGVVVVLNEVPLGTAQYAYRGARLAVSVLLRSLRGRYVEYAPSLSAAGIVYDPYLGDISRSSAQWAAAFAEAGFGCEVVDSGFTPYKGRPERTQLTHFVLRPTRP